MTRLLKPDELYPVNRMRPLGDTPPSKGGCWYCHSKVPHEDDPLVFSTEWDAYVHRGCVQRRLRQVQETGGRDQEVLIFAAELEVPIMMGEDDA